MSQLPLMSLCVRGITLKFWAPLQECHLDILANLLIAAHYPLSPGQADAPSADALSAEATVMGPMCIPKIPVGELQDGRTLKIS